MSFLTQRRTLGFKLETVPYTKETLAAADFDVAAWDINYSPEIAMYARKIARGNFGKEVSIAGKRTITISFSVDAQEGAAAQTAPTYWKCLKACAMKQTAYTTVGVGLNLDSDYSNVPATIEIVEKDEGTSPIQIVIRGRGCMGNARMVVNAIGEPIKYEFEFKGVLDTIEQRAHASILVPTGFNTSVPDAVMGVTVTAYGDVQTVSKVTIDLGNDVQVFTDPAKAEGVSGAHVVDRNPTMEIDPDLISPSTQDFWGRWKDSTEGALVLTVGNNSRITSSSLQVNSAYAPSDREGHVAQTISLIVVDDDLELLQGAKA